jgi:hypothetical protein
MGDGRACFVATFAGLAQVGFDKGAMAFAKTNEGVERLANSRALGPAGTSSSGKGDDGDLSVSKRSFTNHKIFLRI